MDVGSLRPPLPSPTTDLGSWVDLLVRTQSFGQAYPVAQDGSERGPTRTLNFSPNGIDVTHRASRLAHPLGECEAVFRAARDRASPSNGSRGATGWDVRGLELEEKQETQSQDGVFLCPWGHGMAHTTGVTAGRTARPAGHRSVPTVK